EPLDEPTALVASDAGPLRTRGLELHGDAVDDGIGIRSDRTRGARRRQTHHHAFEMRGQGLVPGFGTRGSGFGGAPGGAGDGAHGAAPFVEDVENVGVAEVDLHGPPARALSIVALEAAIDALERDLERDAARGPSGHELERRSDDANQVAVVLAA